jgi:hypothetical protein
VEGLSQEWRCGEPIRRPERQQERCREKQRVKVICLAASFGYLIKCICATKAAEANSRMPGRRQPATKYVLSEDSRRSWKRNHTQWNIVEMQNPAHSLHTVGLRMQASGVGPSDLGRQPPQCGCPPPRAVCERVGEHTTTNPQRKTSEESHPSNNEGWAARSPRSEV